MNLNEIFKDLFIALIFVSVTVASWHVSNTLNTTTIKINKVYTNQPDSRDRQCL